MISITLDTLKNFVDNTNQESLENHLDCDVKNNNLLAKAVISFNKADYTTSSLTLLKLDENPIYSEQQILSVIETKDFKYFGDRTKLVFLRGFVLNTGDSYDPAIGFVDFTGLTYPELEELNLANSKQILLGTRQEFLNLDNRFYKLACSNLI